MIVSISRPEVTFLATFMWGPDPGKERSVSSFNPNIKGSRQSPSALQILTLCQHSPGKQTLKAFFQRHREVKGQLGNGNKPRYAHEGCEG